MNPDSLVLSLNPGVGSVKLDAFIAALDKLSHVLKGFDQNNDSTALSWEVTHLHIASAEAGVCARSHPDESRRRSWLVIDAMQALEEERDLPLGFPAASIEPVCELIEGLARQGNTARLSYGTRSQELSEKGARHGRDVIRTIAWRDVGSLDGSLGLVNVHDARHFFLYEKVTGQRVQCGFRRDQLDVVRAGLGRPVRVWGVVTYNRRGQFTDLEVEGLELLPDPKSLPSIEELAGAIPDLTGGLPAEEYVRRLRDDS